jgi:hypothetical protein
VLDEGGGVQLGAASGGVNQDVQALKGSLAELQAIINLQWWLK